MKPTQILRLSFVSLILVMAISVNQSANGKTPDFNDILKSAQEGDPNAQGAAGWAYYAGEFGVAQDYNEAFKWSKKAAEQGDAHAQCLVGMMYRSGYGVAQDYQEALKWFRKAAGQGFAIAQDKLGVMYYRGEGVTQDYQEAFKWFKKAAEQGDDEAQFSLGLMYKRGEGVAQDYQEAFKWYTKAAEQGFAGAQFSLGLMYDEGMGVTKDGNKAVKWYTKAAEQGFAGAQFFLGLMYGEGRGVPEDYNEAAKWYTKAAAQGLAEAQFSLGKMYAFGDGVPQDYKEAVKWWKKAAEKGNAEAQSNLGTAYYNGRGVTQDYQEALKWFRKAADQGNAWGQCKLGIMYYEGCGVAEDYVEAYKWLILAAAQGYPSDNTIRDSLKEKMTAQQIAEAQKLAKEFRPVISKQQGDESQSKPILVLDEPNNVLSAKTDPNSSTKSQAEIDAQLWKAIEKSDVTAIQAALKNGANPNWVSHTKVPTTVIGYSLLNFCYFRDEDDFGDSQCLEVLQILFKAGAKFQPKYDNQMLFYPVAHGYSEVVELLLSKGADPNNDKEDGVTLVEVAESYGKDKVVSVLIKHGASPISRQDAAQLRLVQCAQDGNFLGLKNAIDKGASIHGKSKISGETALTAAMLFPDFEKYAIVEFLLAKGANPNAKGKEWGTPLHTLMFNSSHLLQDKFSNSPTLQSERDAAISIVDILLKAGANVSARNEKGQTPLHIAARYNNYLGAKKLIESGAKLMDRDDSGKTPLDYAESAEMIKLLKSHGATEQ